MKHCWFLCFLSSNLAILRNKRKLAVINRNNQEDHLGINQSRDTNSSRNQEDYITQVSKDIENRVTNKLSQEVSRTESRIMSGLSRLDEFIQNPLSRARSGPVPETFRNSSRENQGTNEDGSQNDPHPEVGVSFSYSSQELGPEGTCYKYDLRSTTINSSQLQLAAEKL